MINKKLVILANDPLNKLYGQAGMKVNDISFEDNQNNWDGLNEEVERFKSENPDKTVMVIDGDADLLEIPELEGYLRINEPIMYNAGPRDDFAMFLNQDFVPKKYRNVEMMPVRTEPKFGRNEPCRCNSGKKTKNCCK